MFETLLGGVFGGLLRLAPELMKLFDRENERKHELALLQAEMEFAKVRGEIAMRQADAALSAAEISAMSDAFKEQGLVASAAGPVVAAISALVRPTITWAFVVGYFVVKVVTYLMAIEQGGVWDSVLLSLWTKDDMTVMFMIISFWFCGRVYERKGA